MKFRIINSIIFLSAFLIFAACSSTARYTKSIEKTEKRNDTRERKFVETETGTASYYADEFNGKNTASGETYDMNDLTAAHKSYPFNTILKVTNLRNGKSVEVRVNDRMPPFKNRVIDLSFASAKWIDMINSGIQEVKIEVISLGK